MFQHSCTSLGGETERGARCVPEPALVARLEQFETLSERLSSDAYGDAAGGERRWREDLTERDALGLEIATTLMLRWRAAEEAAEREPVRETVRAVAGP